MRNSNEKFLQQGYTIITDKSKMDIVMIHEFLSNKSYWAANIPYDVVKKSIEHSLCFGIFFHQTQIGFARVVTDEATFAYLADVFIIDEHRGKGLSKWLMEIIHEHSSLQGLRRWMLMTRDAHELYEQYGWKNLSPEECKKVMQMHNSGVYKKS